SQRVTAGQGWSASAVRAAERPRLSAEAAKRPGVLRLLQRILVGVPQRCQRVVESGNHVCQTYARPVRPRAIDEHAELVCGGEDTVLTQPRQIRKIPRAVSGAGAMGDVAQNIFGCRL